MGINPTPYPTPYPTLYPTLSPGVNKVMEYIIKEKFREDPSSSSITNLDYSAYMDPAGMGGMGNGMGGSTTSLNYGSFDGTCDSYSLETINNSGIVLLNNVTCTSYSFKQPLHNHDS